MGDEDEDDEITEQAQDILQKINQEAQERKKANSKKQKKKKKRQHSDGDEAEGDSDERQNVVPKKIKLEKNSKELQESEEDNDKEKESEDISDRLKQKDNLKNSGSDVSVGSKTEPNDINGNDKEENDEIDTLHEGQLHNEIGGFTVIGDVRKKRKDKVCVNFWQYYSNTWQ